MQHKNPAAINNKICHFCILVGKILSLKDGEILWFNFFRNKILYPFEVPHPFVYQPPGLESHGSTKLQLKALLQVLLSRPLSLAGMYLKVHHLLFTLSSVAADFLKHYFQGSKCTAEFSPAIYYYATIQQRIFTICPAPLKFRACAQMIMSYKIPPS